MGGYLHTCAHSFYFDPHWKETPNDRCLLSIDNTAVFRVRRISENYSRQCAEDLFLQVHKIDSGYYFEGIEVKCGAKEEAAFKLVGNEDSGRTRYQILTNAGAGLCLYAQPDEPHIGAFPEKWNDIDTFLEEGKRHENADKLFLIPYIEKS